MTTLLVAGRARCTRRCWDATEPECTCPCGGAYHGVGLERARAMVALELPGEDVVLLPELPFGESGGTRTGRHTGARCGRCGGTERLEVYGDGLFCLGCRRAALVLVEA